MWKLKHLYTLLADQWINARDIFYTHSFVFYHLVSIDELNLTGKRNSLARVDQLCGADPSADGKDLFLVSLVFGWNMTSVFFSMCSLSDVIIYLLALYMGPVCVSGFVTINSCGLFMWESFIRTPGGSIGLLGASSFAP